MKQIMVMLMLTLLVSSVWAEIFRDNFNDGDLQGWTFVQGAEDGGIENGELVLGSPKGESGAKVMIAVNGIIARDCEVSVSLKISKLARNISGGASIGLGAHTDPLLQPFIESQPFIERARRTRRPVRLYDRSFRFSLGNIDTGDNMHIQDIRNIRKGLAATTREENLKTFVRGKLYAFREFNFKLHEWYRLKIIAKGTRFQCFVDNKKMLDFFDETYTEGGIYLASSWGSRVHFDNFEVQYEALSVQPRRQLATTWGQIKSNLH